MNRRTTLIAPLAALGTLAVMRPSRVFASVSDLSGSSYKAQVLSYGTLSKETSKLAKARAATTYVREFAVGEILEQDAVGQSLTKMANPPPAPLTPMQQAALAMVQNASAAEFDTVYVDVQLKGHEALLKLQDEFLGMNPDYVNDTVHVALIARAFIQNHIYILKQFKSGAIQ